MGRAEDTSNQRGPSLSMGREIEIDGKTFYRRGELDMSIPDHIVLANRAVESGIHVRFAPGTNEFGGKEADILWCCYVSKEQLGSWDDFWLEHYLRPQLWQQSHKVAIWKGELVWITDSQQAPQEKGDIELLSLTGETLAVPRGSFYSQVGLCLTSEESILRRIAGESGIQVHLQDFDLARKNPLSTLWVAQGHKPDLQELVGRYFLREIVGEEAGLQTLRYTLANAKKDPFDKEGRLERNNLTQLIYGATEDVVSQARTKYGDAPKITIEAGSITKIPINMLVRLPAMAVLFLQSQASFSEKPLQISFEISNERWLNWPNRGDCFKDGYTVVFVVGSTKDILRFELNTFRKAEFPEDGILPSGVGYYCSFWANVSPLQPTNSWDGKAFTEEINESVHKAGEAASFRLNEVGGHREYERKHYSSLGYYQELVRKLGYVEVLLNLLERSLFEKVK
ncbi:hypothetical protein HY612_02760 [Candidatus Roizmanbacteria bacterium]|nr:hypothetical protein [Candidatus Roizmanbacteria bacterium]